MYEPRTYRSWVRDKDLVSFNVAVKETDLQVRASRNIQRKALRLVMKYRAMLEDYIERNSEFLTTLEPLAVGEDAPLIAREMAVAADIVGVGPMAAVAGAIAEFVGKELLAFSPEVIIENGGDIFLKSSKDRVIGIYAGNSPLTGKIGLEIRGEETPLGVCTSSGTVGHSLSFGKADAVVTLAKSALLADAAATGIGNLVSEPGDIESAIDFARGIAGLEGVVIIIGESIGLSGNVRLCATASD